MRALFVRRFLAAWGTALVVSGVTYAAEPAPAKIKLDPRLVEQGRALFERRWVENDPLTPHGDGLGPMRNANSCVECHSQGGVGGGGPAFRNVQLLTVKITPEDLVATDKSGTPTFSARLSKANPAFLIRPDLFQRTVILHQFGAQDGYDVWRDAFLWGVPRALTGATRASAMRAAMERVGFQSVKELSGPNGLGFFLSERNTPAMFGADQIDSIPTETILQLEKQQAALSSAITGRAARIKQMALVRNSDRTPPQPPPVPSDDDRVREINVITSLDAGVKVTFVEEVGRFGWRAQTTSLSEFVLGACAAELGLSSPGHAQSRDPMLPPDTAASARNTDLSAEQCEQMVAFVRSLPAPRRVVPTNSYVFEDVRSGEQVFVDVKCAVCHVANVGDVVGLYSDLLLHDMGDGLRDPLPAPSGKEKALSGFVVYYGPTDIDFNEDPILAREWRTPPLWGVADSAPYLHDGRAATLEQAILEHGGEAVQSVQRFKLLSERKRQDLLVFLGTLRAPGDGDLAQRSRFRKLGPPLKQVTMRSQESDPSKRPRPTSAYAQRSSGAR